ncbi:hypothetical protein ACLIKD_06805 [Azonexus sp. IMCC34842]|uniref:hypothetical protein n=1 Tax=Azonexus sp. IMCC34842 TaxID=3420950 RepID=UPI003D0A57AC
MNFFNQTTIPAQPRTDMEKFVEITRKDKGFEKENQWFETCRRERIPFVTVKARSNLATVQWDYISYPTSMDKPLFSMHADIKARAEAIYDRYRSKDTSLGVGPGVVSFGNLHINDARQVAIELFDIIHNAARVATEKPDRAAS